MSKEKQYNESERPKTGDVVRWVPYAGRPIYDGSELTARYGDCGVIENIDESFAPLVTVRFSASRRSWDCHPANLRLVSRK